MHKPNILVVDDEPINQEIMEELLDGDYQLTHASTGEACLQQLSQSQPDLILMDVKMPGIDGLETCRRIKLDSATHSIPVIFVSALSNADEKMAGYEAGGDDYLSKPFDEAELRAKISVVLANRQQLEQSKQASQEAMSVAMVAMTNAGEIGGVLNFFRNSFGCVTLQELGELLINAHTEYGLHCSVVIHHATESVQLSYAGIIHPLEFAIIEKLRSAGRIYDFGHRSVFNYPNLSILVLNMPVDDPERCGRFKDHIALLGAGAQGRIEAMNAQLEQQRQKDHLDQVVTIARAALSRFEKEGRENKYRLTNAMEELVVKTERLMMSLGLTEEQEEALLNTIKETDSTIVRLFDEENNLGKLLDNIIQMLDQ